MSTIRGFLHFALLELERFDTEIIDEFRHHLASAIADSRGSINRRAANVTESEFESIHDYRSFMDIFVDEAYELEQIADLGHELAIIALYKKGEIASKIMIRHYLPKIPQKGLFNFQKLKNALPFDIATLVNYAAYNELRQINNCIKHQGSVDAELVSINPKWTEGENLKGLSDDYERLRPLVQSYIGAFALECRKHTTR